MITYEPNISVSLAGNITGNAATVTGLAVATGKTLTASKTITITSSNDTSVATLPAGTKTLLAADGDGSSLTGVSKPADIGTAISAVATGTVYSLTDTSAKVDFGTTDPAIVVNVAGTYLITAVAKLHYTGATFAGRETATLKLRRTNNTAADVGSADVVDLDILTTETGHAGMAVIQAVYTTTATDDAIELFGAVSTAPSAGSLDVEQAKIYAVRLK